MRSLLGLGLVLLTGCGYHTAGSATHIPAGISVLAIPTFKNRTHAYHTEVAFTSAVIHEMNTRTKYRIINSATAPSDATLEGTILTESVAPLTYDSSSGATSSYLITLTAKVVLTSSTGRVLYQNSKFSFRSAVPVDAGSFGLCAGRYSGSGPDGARLCANAGFRHTGIALNTTKDSHHGLRSFAMRRF